MRRILAVLLLLTAVSFNAAADNAVRASISCGKWLASKDSKGEVPAIYSWGAVGYLSGVNTTSKVDVVEKVDVETILLYIDTHCKAKPLSNQYAAVLHLFFEMGGTLEMPKKGNGKN